MTQRSQRLTMNKQTIGKRIKAFRLRKELTQEKAAAILDVSLATLQRLEAGSTNASDLTLAKIERRIENQKERESVAA